MDINNVIQKRKKKKNEKKKKESWLNSVQFQHVTKWQKHILFPKKLKYRHPRNKKHTCLNFLIESQSWHTDIHVIVKLCKKPIFFFKDNIKSASSCEEACHKNSLTHSLHSFKSPDIILSATRRRKTEKKAPAPTKKTKRRFVCTVSTPWRTELCPTRPPGQDLDLKPCSRTAGRGVWWNAFLTNPKNP